MLPPAGGPKPAPSLDSSGLPKTFMPSDPPADLSTPKKVPGENKQPFDIESLTPPTIDRGEPMPPITPAPTVNPAMPVTLDMHDGLEVELGRIPLPAQLASSSTDLDSSRRAQQNVMPQDTRIVELRFHPSLTRSINIDGKGDDDGLYVVLQPYNERGEFVPIGADVMILALDVSRDEQNSKIGRWTFSAADIKSKMQPIGTSQGIHLTLPFTGPAPQCDRVQVFAYYTTSEGRRVVAEQEVLLNNAHRQSTVWVPRARSQSNDPSLGSSNPVRTASGERPVKK